jgi:hypothetical protein
MFPLMLAGKRQVGPWVQRGGSGVFALASTADGGTLSADNSPKPCVLTFEPDDGSAGM